MDIVSSLGSIIDSLRSFYVGAASPIDKDGFISLNGIKARVAGNAIGNDVIVKDSKSGEWVAFVRGAENQVLRNTVIQLYQKDPSPVEEFPFLWFISTEGIEAPVIVNEVQQLAGTFVMGAYPVYYAELGEWLIAFPEEFNKQLNYLQYRKPTKIHNVAGDARFEQTTKPQEVGDPLDYLLISTSNTSLRSLATIDIKSVLTPVPAIDDIPRLDVFILFKINPIEAATGIRQDIERWAIGLTKSRISKLDGDFSIDGLKKSLCLGFKREKPNKYGFFYSYYLHTYNFTNQWRDPTEFSPPPVSCPVASTSFLTEYPLLRVDNFPATTFTIFTANSSIPPTTAEIFDYFFEVAFHSGNGDFLTESNLTYRSFPMWNGDILINKIRYTVTKTDPIARKVRLYIQVNGVNYYASQTRYKDSNAHRIAFYKDAPDALILSYYVGTSDIIPRKNDPSTVTDFLLEEYLQFPNTGIGVFGDERLFADDYFLWSTEYRPRTVADFSSIGYVDSTFSEDGTYGKCTFFRQNESGKYNTPATIFIEILPEEVWAHKEELSFYTTLASGGESLAETIELPIPRLNIDTLVKVRVREFDGSFTSGICGDYGACKADYSYQSSQRTICIRIRDVINNDPLSRYYFLGKKSISIVHEYPANIFRTGKLYVEVSGQRYYATTRSTPVGGQALIFREANTSFASGAEFIIEVGSEIPRGKKFSIVSGNRVLVTDPFLKYVTFPVGADKRYAGDTYLWFPSSTSGSNTPGFDTFGYIDSTFQNIGEDNTLFSSIPTPDAARLDGLGNPIPWIPVTLAVEYHPDNLWGKSERITLDEATVLNGSHCVEPLLGDDSFYSTAGIHGGIFARLQPFDEEFNSVDGVNAIIANLLPCAGTTPSITNRTVEDIDRNAFFGYLHLLPSQSQSIDLSPSTLSFSGTSLVIYGDGRILLGDIELIPYHAALDTTDFTESNLRIAGAVLYREGLIDNETTGETSIPALSIRWERGFCYNPSLDDYYDDYNDDKYVNFEVVLVDLGTRIDVLYRYIYTGGNIASENIFWNSSDYDTGYIENTDITSPAIGSIGVPIAGISKETSIFSGSGTRNKLSDLPTRTINGIGTGEAQFYIKDGQIHGYGEITLFEDGAVTAPIRKAITESSLYEPQYGLLRVEHLAAVGEAQPTRKVTFFLSKEIDGNGDLDLATPLSPILSAETSDGEPPAPEDPPPLLNKSKLI